MSIEEYPDCILPGTSNDDINFIDINENDWYYWSETYGMGGKLNTTIAKSPIEMLRVTSDTTEYIWYTPDQISFEYDKQYCLKAPNVDDVQYIYIYDITNQKLLFGGNFNSTATICWNNTASSSTKHASGESNYNISLLICSFGLVNTGYNYETYTKGLVGPIYLNNENINQSNWISEGRLYGEYLQLFRNTSISNSNPNFKWTKYSSNSSSSQEALNKSLTWWQTTFITPSSLDVNSFESIAIDMIGATKGFIFVNGFNLGRYWLIESDCSGIPKSKQYISMQWAELQCEQNLPLQRYYSLPVDYLKPSGETNHLVIIEEKNMRNLQNISLVYCDKI